MSLSSTHHLRPTLTSRRALVASVIAALVLLVWFLVGSQLRFVGADEGFYALATQLTSQGNTLYSDFFYPQMPGFPLIYSQLLPDWAEGWRGYRALTGLWAAGCGILVWYSVLKTTGRIRLAALATLLFATNELSVGWLPMVKPYSLSLLLLLGFYQLTCILTERANEGSHTTSRSLVILSACAGFCLGAATLTRLYVVVASALFLVPLWRTRTRGVSHLLKLSSGAALGFFLSLTPALWSAWRNPSSFYFNNWDYHQLRSTLQGSAALWQKWDLLKELTGASELSLMSFQFSLLVLGVGFLKLTSSPLTSIQDTNRSATDTTLLSLTMALLLSAVSLIPTPSWSQYFVLAVPFLCIGLTIQFSRLTQTRAARTLPVFLICYLSLGFTHVTRYWHSGRKVHAVPQANPESMRLATIVEVTNQLNQLAPKGSTVLSRWPGYLVGTHARPVSGLENQYWARVYKSMTAKDLTKFHVGSPELLRQAAVLPKTETIIVGRKSREGWQKAIPKDFVLCSQLKGHKILRRNCTSSQ